ncbi:MAG: serine/threonine-protein kinase [Planctomycetota bacterium]|nr:serine/threonine-protein kinase [Planctomycetota bacterium]
MNPSSDKNLLFALIAHHNGYISMEQFFEAAAVWNKEPKRELGEILVEKNFLDEVERFNIQGIVEDRVRRQGGIDDTLSFIVASGSVPQKDALPEDWQDKIDAITQVISNKTSPNPPNFGTPEANRGIHRYIIRKSLGHGGQGYVWEAIDTELNRRVAIKNIVPSLSSDPLHQELLIDEARKTGKLGHPGVPPVFDIGKDADGKPFFTMQLISGKKLSESYETLKYESISRSDFVNQIRPLLRHLIAACNTVEFAFDSEAVIHRDLKPANIMVNRYGETVVMDWGMGKIISDPSHINDDASSVLFIPITQGSSSEERTSVGTIKGTAAFMSPEQARAENDKLDHRTDVYGLGAILYWILTGQAPHKRTRDALPDIQKNRFPTPSQARPSLSIPPEIEAICLKAMASQPADRYQKAGQMAADLENFIAGEPVVALPENLPRKTERFLRKHARAVTASLLGLSLATVGLALANRIIASKNVQLQNSRAVSTKIMEDLVGGLTDNRLAQIPQANGARQSILQEIATEVNDLIGENPDDNELKLNYVNVLIRLGKLEGDLVNEQEAIERFERAHEILEQTKTISDPVFRENWKKTFFDESFYHATELIKQQKIDQADPIVEDVIAIAEKYSDSIKSNAEKTKDFSVFFARLYRQRASIHVMRGNWQQALVETIKAKNVLKPFVEGPLSKLTSESEPLDLTTEEGKKIFRVLGYYLLFCGDQGDYEIVSEKRDKYDNAEKSFLESLDVAKILSKTELPADGKIQTVNNLRKLQRLALITENETKADMYYQQVMDSTSKETSSFPIFQKYLYFVECDRARGLAKINLEEAKKALENAKQMNEKLIVNGESAKTEFEYYLAAAETAIEKAIDGNSPKLPSLELEKTKLFRKMEELNAGKLKIRELNYLP